MLKVETQKLEREVEAARNEYAKASGDLIAADAPARVLDSFRLDPATGCHELALEAPSAIFAVSVQSDVPVDLIDARDVSVICARSTPGAGIGRGGVGDASTDGARQPRHGDAPRHRGQAGKLRVRRAGAVAQDVRGNACVSTSNHCVCTCAPRAWRRATGR